MTRRVLVHRNLLFVPNEAYIAAQVRHIRRYQPLLSGLRIDPRGVVPDDILRVVLQELSTPWRTRSDEWRLKFLRRAPEDFLRPIRAFAPELMHVHFGGDAWWSLPIRRALRVPLVVTFHGYDVNQRASSSVGAFVYSRLRPQVFREASRVIAVSDFLATRLVEAGCPQEKLVRHYVGVDTNFFSRRRAPDERPTVSFVGRLVDFKGCDTLMNAIAKLPAAGDLHLIVAGTGPEESRLRRLAGGLGLRVEFAGAVDREGVRSILERSHVFCSPSKPSKAGHTESMGIAALEAQSMSVPVIASRIGGIPEGVRDGETGLLVPPDDADALAEALTSVLGDESRRRQMAVMARENAIANFDIAAQTAELERIYDSVVAG